MVPGTMKSRGRGGIERIWTGNRCSFVCYLVNDLVCINVVEEGRAWLL